MIFAADMVDEILAGRKTVTRRPYKGVDCRYVPGRTYAVQPGRGKGEVARIRIVGVDQRRQAGGVPGQGGVHVVLADALPRAVLPGAVGLADRV